MVENDSPWKGGYTVGLFWEKKFQYFFIRKELGPLAVCSTQNSFNCNSANIGDMNMIEICFIMLLE